MPKLFKHNTVQNSFASKKRGVPLSPFKGPHKEQYEEALEIVKLSILDPNEVGQLNKIIESTEAPALTMHAPIPEHAPDQPEKVEPDAGEAVRVIDEPVVWVQLLGLQVMVPEPEPSLVVVTE